MTSPNEWLLPSGSRSSGAWEVVIDPADTPGWQHTGLRVGALDGAELRLPAGGVERMVVPLTGEVRVSWVGPDGEGSFVLGGRDSVFDGPADTAYLGVGTSVILRGEGRVAVAEAPATRPLPISRMSRDDVPVELLGAGSSTRQVHNFGVPGGLEAQKLLVCEVITPAGNWSSFPPHKHDEHVPGRESRLEEIYYFEAAVARDAAGAPDADPFGLFAAYSSAAGPLDISALVRTGDVALVPYGYHGPAAAPPGYDLYYLNVMAGPADERVWLITDDPAHGWVRSTWDSQAPDPRLPYRRPAAPGREVHDPQEQR
jgi:5-deoxy-glucuronate isomerase